MILASAHPHPGVYVPPPPMGFTVASLVWLVVGLIVVGLIMFVVGKAPIDEPYKGIARAVILVVVVIAVILWIARAAGFM